MLYIRARVEVLAERLRKRTFERHIRHGVPRERLGGVPRLLFDYDETPLLLVDSSAIDFVDDRATSKTCYAKSTAPVTGSHSYVARKS
jgi:deoxyguanosine kinase